MVDGVGVILRVLNANESGIPINDTADQIYLKVDRIDHSIQRNPSIFGVPEVNRDSGGQPAAFAIDFGTLTETITLSGVSSDGEVGQSNPSHHQIAEVVRTHWRFVEPDASGSLGIKGGAELIIEEGEGHGTHRYRGVILQFRANREGGRLRWEYSLTLQVARWPVE